MSDVDDDLPGHVDRVLAEFLRDAGEPVRRVTTFGEALDALTRFVLGGGKRIRPTFAWWAWRGAGGAATGPEAEGALQAVAALELIQACALIHDDLIDDSDSRRGSPTVHVAFTKKHADSGWHGESHRFGLAASVLIGDVALAWADDMFASAPLPAATLAGARPAWRAMRTEVLAGQYLDVRTQASGDSSAEAAMWVNELKTAAYTVQRPLHMGASLAGAPPEVVDPLLSFGKNIGVAFQLRDDLLGVFGDPDVTGKPAGDDLREGKRTLLVSRGIHRARERDDAATERAVVDALGDRALSDERLTRARQALVDIGAVADVEQHISELTEVALAALESAPLADPARAKLTDLAFAATKRSK